MTSGTWTYEPTTFTAGSDPNNNNGIPPDPSWANLGISGRRASLLYNNNVALAAAPGIVSIGTVGNTTQAQRISALAIAIWEALYEDAGTGLFSVSTRSTTGRGFSVVAPLGTDVNGNNAVNTANYWLGALNGPNAGSLGPDATWFAELEDPDVQSLLGPVLPVPEPGTYLAGMLLLLPFLANRVNAWRRKRV